MSFSFSRPMLAAMSGWLVLVCSAAAQTAPTLREAMEAAWALSPSARALQNRQTELDARARAAASLIPGPPTVSLSQRKGMGNASGLSESEVEVSAPLWQPRVRSATSVQVEADRAAFDRQLALAKIRLASEVRELAAQAALARIEREVAGRKLAEAAALASDVERRVKAGESARIDLIQAQSVQRQASAAQALAESSLARALAQWRAITGLPQLAVLDETPAQPGDHPAVTSADAQVHAARAKLSLTEADRRDPMEVGLGVARERGAGGGPSEKSVKLSLRVPLGSHGRNAPKLAAARAELDAAEAEADAARRTAIADRESAAAELEAARRGEALAIERERFAQEAQALVAKSHRLGESDLPTRLRAEAERFDAELARAKAGVETRRAISKFNQSNGSLP